MSNEHSGSRSRGFQFTLLWLISLTVMTNPRRNNKRTRPSSEPAIRLGRAIPPTQRSVFRPASATFFNRCLQVNPCADSSSNTAEFIIGRFQIGLCEFDATPRHTLVSLGFSNYSRFSLKRLSIGNGSGNLAGCCKRHHPASPRLPSNGGICAAERQSSLVQGTLENFTVNQHNQFL